jgi:hypothetical protein
MNDFIMDEMKRKILICLTRTSYGIDIESVKQTIYMFSNNTAPESQNEPTANNKNLLKQSKTLLDNSKSNSDKDKIKTLKGIFTTVFDKKYFGNVAKTWWNRDVKKTPIYKDGLDKFTTELARITVELYNLKALEYSVSSDIIHRGTLNLSHGGNNKQYTKRYNKLKPRLSKTAKKQPHVGGGLDLLSISPLRRFAYVMTQPIDQQYREMLREYTILTANYSLISNEYAMHYNEASRIVGIQKFNEKYNEFEKNNEEAMNTLNSIIKTVDTTTKPVEPVREEIKSANE